MRSIYINSSNNDYRYALGKLDDAPNRLLFCFGINPSTATPEKLDPTAKRIEKIAKEHNYDSWVILNICAQRATKPDNMLVEQNLILHKHNLKIIADLLEQYSLCSDILFAYGNLIDKRPYLKKNLCEIINIIKSTNYSGNCYCLGTTISGNARHPLYQKTNTPFMLYSLDGHTYSELFNLEDDKCVIVEYNEHGEAIEETIGFTCS